MTQALGDRFASTPTHELVGRLTTDTCLRRLADCILCLQNASMGIQITIRDVPEKVRDELAARAALQGKSMQEYLKGELERLAARPSVDAWLAQVRKRKRASQTRISTAKIVKERDADRR
jgi:plasmid stability protein